MLLKLRGTFRAHAVRGSRLQLAVEITFHRNPFILNADLATPRAHAQKTLEIDKPLGKSASQYECGHAGSKNHEGFERGFVPVVTKRTAEKQRRQITPFIEPRNGNEDHEAERLIE